MATAKSNHARLETLAKSPRYLRGPVARGFSPDPAQTLPEDMFGVDRTGGMFKCGMIRGVSMCTRGEALGHGLWLDSLFISQVQGQGAALPKGVKCRFTHPGLSGDGLGTFLGRLSNCRLQNNRVIGDLHFSPAAQRTPDGDLAAYVMDLAESDPQAFGASIVFEGNYEAEEQFLLDNGAVWAEGEDGPELDCSDFVSPDPTNTKNLPHARLAELRATDIVDDPAANPGGLFQREQQFAREAEGLMSFALGLSDARPALTAFSIEPDRVKAFAARFLENHGLAIVAKGQQVIKRRIECDGQAIEETFAIKEQSMSKEETAPATQPEQGAGATGSETQPAEGGQTDTSQPETKPADETNPAEEAKPAQEAKPGAEEKPAEAKPGEQTQASTGPGKKFLDAFGDKGGLWFAQGKSFEEAQNLFNADLRAQLAAKDVQIAALTKRLSAVDRGDTAPVTFQDGQNAAGEVKPGKGTNLELNIGKGLAAFANSIKLPVSKDK